MESAFDYGNWKRMLILIIEGKSCYLLEGGAFKLIFNLLRFLYYLGDCNASN